ncbi:hypothetical protein WS83_18255 [Burkholderia sp. MSMB2042]|nr:hypothetical protein WS83_18255 [Burkholderia sp. MSMB2042]
MTCRRPMTSARRAVRCGDAYAPLCVRYRSCVSPLGNGEAAKRRSGIGRRTVTHRSTRRAGAHSRITPGRPPYAPLDTPTYA